MDPRNFFQKHNNPVVERCTPNFCNRLLLDHGLNGDRGVVVTRPVVGLTAPVVGTPVDANRCPVAEAAVIPLPLQAG